MDDQTSISFKPTLKSFREIETWLIKEYNKTKQGFYCNWNIIEDSYQNNRLGVISVKNKAVGFIAWRESDLVAIIQICEIKPSERGKGYLRTFFYELSSYFLDKNIIAISLECAPPTSEPVWKRLGFKDFPESPKFGLYAIENKELYKLLVSDCLGKEIFNNDEIIELWNREPHETDDIDPIWTLPVLFKTDSTKLINWIIMPCKPDWRIRWRKGNIVYKDSKVKYFHSERIEYGKFVVIRSLFKK